MSPAVSMDGVEGLLLGHRVIPCPWPKVARRTFCAIGCGEGSDVPAIFEHTKPLHQWGVDYKLNPGGVHQLYRDLTDSRRIGAGIERIRSYVEANGVRELLLY